MPRITGSSKTWNVEHGVKFSDFPTVVPAAAGGGGGESNQNTSTWKKFRLLLWKNWTIQKRHKWQIFLEIFLPIFCSIILIITRVYVPADYQSIPTGFVEYHVDTPPYETVYSKCNELYYAPKNPATDALMREVGDVYFTFTDKKYKITGFDTEEELVATYTRIQSFFEEEENANGSSSSSSSSSVLDLFLESGVNVPILAGVIFNGGFSGDGGGMEFDGDIEYKLRFPAKQRSEFDLISERFGLKAAWYTEILYPYVQLPGPRARFSYAGGLPGYNAEGFLYLQNAIEQTLLRTIITDPAALDELESYDVALQRFPYPPYMEDKFVFSMQGVLPVLIMLSLMYPILNITRTIVLEKEKKLKESMKMMGLPNLLHWVAWIIRSFTFLLIALVLMTLLLTIKFSSQAVVAFTDPTLLFVVILAFSIQACAIAFFVSTLANSANIGAIASAVVWFIFFIPYAFLQPRYFLMSRFVKVLFSFFTNAPIALACFLLCIFESRGKGLQWADLFTGIGPGDDFCMFDCLMVILFNSGFYFLLTVYVESVWPGEYGVPLPFYYPLTVWYWTGKQRYSGPRILGLTPVPPKHQLLEPDPPSRYAGIRIQGLTKRFGKKIAVKNLYLNMYENQITALLGHNGAGKTTTMSMLVGLYPPTSGTALINDHDVQYDIDSVRSSLGVCPQHDVLFEDLTVEEHIQFFCLLKGFPEEFVPAETDRMLKVLGLEEKRKCQAHTLSGGMRRKLSVSIAFCGGSKVVLLDEPTSGMDPSARRSCWDLIQSEKKGRTVLLSTHFMEEADLLGDRIAIMAEGELQCCGTSLFLKKKYGGGYQLKIVKNENCDVEQITSLIRKCIPDATISQNVGAELCYTLSDERSNLFPQMFEELEERKTELGIDSYGASITTMEEVFIKVGREAEKRITDSYEKISKANSGSGGGRQASSTSITTTAPAPAPADAAAAAAPSLTPTGRAHVGLSMSSLIDSNSQTNLHQDCGRRNTGSKLLRQQLRAMVVKKLIYFMRNWLLVIGQMVVPVLYIVVILAVAGTFPALFHATPLQISLRDYDDFGGVVSSAHCAEPPSPVCQAFKESTIAEGYTLKETGQNESMFDFLVKKQIVDITLVMYRYIVAFEETISKNSSRTTITAFFNNEPFHTPPLAYNLYTNALLRALGPKNESTTRSIRLTNHPMPYTKIESGMLAGQVYSLSFQVGYNLCFGTSFLAAGFVVFLIAERESRSKHLQLIAGVRPAIFWLANYMIDFCIYLLPCLCIMVVLHLFQIQEYTSPEMTLNMFILFVVFGLAIIPHMYLWSFAFDEPSNGFVRIAILNVFCGMVPMMVHAILTMAEFNLGTVANTVNEIFMVFPTYAFGNGVVQMAKNIILRDQCGLFFPSEESLEFGCLLMHNFCCDSIKENFFDWEVNGIGKNVAALAIFGFLSILILILHELRVFDRFKSSGKKTTTSATVTAKAGDKKKKSDKKKLDELIVEDQDVADERVRIHKTPLEQLEKTDNLVLRDLTKRYGKFLAVDRLNLGVERGQTFGLLGLNGAGKTTTFKMLTGDYQATSGDAFISSHSIRNDIKGVHRNLGYCPQFDGLIGEMTGRETLQMFGRLRGIFEEDLGGMIEKVSTDLTFSQHLDKLVKEYSGGNKRKLSTAMALVGNPPLIFLDEPSTGMDPVARRHLWSAMTSIRESGASIILTSHSLEETEILCSRLAIMVNGVFRCLGSPQHLKNKFAEGYTIIAQCPPPAGDADASESSAAKIGLSRAGFQRSSSRKGHKTQQWETALDGLRNFIEDAFPGAILKDIHPGFVHYHVRPSPSITWGKLFGKMELAKELFKLDAYSVGQTSLEQVFLNFAKSQIEVDERVKSKGFLHTVLNSFP